MPMYDHSRCAERPPRLGAGHRLALYVRADAQGDEEGRAESCPGRPSCTEP